MTEHKCIDCGAIIAGRRNKKRCDECRKKAACKRTKEWTIKNKARQKEYQCEYYHTRKRPTPSPICKGCGEVFVKASPAQQYCDKCKYDRFMKRPKHKRRHPPIAQVEREARAHGLSYGKYVAEYLT